MFHQSHETEEKNLIEQGFTLVELLIVIVIMGILAGIVVFAVGNLTDGASKNGCISEADTVRTAVAAYKANNTNTIPTWAQLTGATGTLDGTSVKFRDSAGPAASVAVGKWFYDPATGIVTKESTKCT